METLENKEDYKIMNIDENSAFGINTSEIEDKIESCRNLSIYIDEMGESFHPWIETIYPITRDHLLFEYSKEVKTTGAHVASALVQSAILIDKKGNQLITSSSRSVAIFHYLFPALYNVIKVEKFPEYLSPYLYTLAEVFFFFCLFLFSFSFIFYYFNYFNFLLFFILIQYILFLFFILFYLIYYLILIYFSLFYFNFIYHLF